MDVKRTLLAAKAGIERKMCDKEGEPVDGAVSLCVAARTKVGYNRLSNSEKDFCDDFLETFGFDELPYEVESFRTTSTRAGIAILEGRPVCLSAMMNMMRSWVDYCAGVVHSYPVALNKSQLERIRREYYDENGCTPEESGFSPRGGAMVVELVCVEAGWLAIQLDVICLSALGPERDMQIAKEIVDFIVRSLTTWAVPNLKSHGLKENGRYPEM